MPRSRRGQAQRSRRAAGIGSSTEPTASAHRLQGICDPLGDAGITGLMKDFIVGCVAACVAGIAVAEPAELAALVSRNTAARGGAEAIESVSDFEADLHIVEPTFEVDGRYVATRDGRMRIDILAKGERVFTEALGRDRAWSWNPEGGVVTASPQGRAALRHGIEFPFKVFGLHELAERGHQLESAGRERIAGIDYDVLRLTLDDGFETRYYLNPDSGLIERERQNRALHVDIDPAPKWIETEYSDWRKAGRVLYPHRMVEREIATGKVLSTATTLAIRLNTSPAAERFEAP